MNIHQLRQGVRASAPTVAMLLGVLLLVIPLRLGQGYLPTPLFPMMIVFLYSVYDQDALPAPAVFAIGLLHDLVYGGGLGVWAAAYLCLQYLVFTQSEYLQGRVPHVIWLAFAVAATMVGGLFWAVQSLLAGGWLPFWPLALQWGVTIAVYPFVSTLFFYLRARASAVRER
ncbi:MAG: hypothetical protein AAF986_02175 [Pseudomonadota bacterium]